MGEREVRKLGHQMGGCFGEAVERRWHLGLDMVVVGKEKKVDLKVIR